MLAKSLKSFKIAKQSALLVNNSAKSFGSLNDPPVRVAVTGAAGNIAYSTLFRIASG